ncbi:MAG: diguanylate cyclase [Desulfobacteraceae bacterium]|nr:diguanylate cyclase [Desulfobacteraceae bacterium]
MEFTILLMDDEAEILGLLSRALQNEGHQVITACDGKKGVKKFQTHNPDLVITDVKMPFKNGLDVLREIRQLNSEIDIIILTGHSDEATAIECLRNGAYDYLTKPLEDMEVFFSAVDRALSKRQQSLEKNKLIRQLAEMSVSDPLTELYNYRQLQLFLDEEIDRSQRYGRVFSVFMIDIDHFKSVNDIFGHPFGDYVLKQMAILCCNIFRKTDHVCRYGGEEFFILLPETPRQEAVVPGQRLVDTLQKYIFNCDGQQTQITISLGGACFPEHAIKKIELVSLADQALYTAKKTGRNKMVFYTTG